MYRTIQIDSERGTEMAKGFKTAKDTYQHRKINNGTEWETYYYVAYGRKGDPVACDGQPVGLKKIAVSMAEEWIDDGKR